MPCTSHGQAGDRGSERDQVINIIIVIRRLLGKPMGDKWEQLRREPAQAFDPATIKHEGDRVCGRVSGLPLD